MEQQTKPNVLYNNNPSKKISLKIIIAFLVVIILISGGFVLRNRLFSKTGPDKIIAKVGQESIFQIDYDKELNAYPVKNEKNLKEKLLAKIAEDSAILQAGQAEGIVQTDSATYNSPKKNYIKRVQLVSEVKKTIKEKTDHIDGGIVSVFFINNLDNKPGPLGYDGSKKLALSKISAVYNQVKDDQISIFQAGQILRNDTSLAQLDYSYKLNAYYPFSVNPGKEITIIKELDQALFNTRVGQTTDIYVGKLKDSTGKEVDGVYMFGQVTSRVPNATVESLDKWIEQSKKKYAPIYY